MGLAIHTFDDIMRVTENLNAKYIVGYGASGTVYKCALKNSRPIAIKRPYNQHPHNSREFETELETIGNIRHRNLVTLHGYALTPNGNLLFYDYMENGSLWDLLHGIFSNLETTPYKFSLCYEISSSIKNLYLVHGNWNFPQINDVLILNLLTHLILLFEAIQLM